MEARKGTTLRKITKRIVGIAVASAVVAAPLVGFVSSANAAVCTAALAKAEKAVAASVAVKAPWDGPKSGPKAAKGKTLIYVAQTMQNGGVAGAAAGVKEAAKAIGWKVRVIDGQGTPAGISRKKTSPV